MCPLQTVSGSLPGPQATAEVAMPLALWSSLAQPAAEHSRGWVRSHRKNGDQPGTRRGRLGAARPSLLPSRHHT